jgi:hypothetical protein
MKQLIIDPPSGWKYGFPKPIPEDRRNDSLIWLVEQGYPQELIDELGEHFYCRYWESDTCPICGMKDGNHKLDCYGP